MMQSGAGGHCVVITGASRGIGFATAQRFLEAGFRVVNLSRSPSGLQSVVDIAVDLTAADWCENAQPALARAVDGASTLSIVHNSAVNVPAGIADVEAADLRRMLEVGIIGPSRLNRLLLDRMRAGSAIVYVGSTLSLRATAGMAAYVTLKHAILGLMRATCQDLAGKGIHTCCVCPGFTETEMLRAYGGETLARLASLSTQNRLIAPREIADVIHFAVTHPVLNGAALSADLGFIEP